MRNSLKYAVSSLALAAAPFMASQAHAQGAYIGVSAGYGWGDADLVTQQSGTGYFADSSEDAINVAGVQEADPKAFIGGVDVGYDFQAGNLIFGVAADISIFRDTKGASTTVVYPCCGPTEFTIDQAIQTRWLATVRGRVGVDVGGAVIYATGGYAGIKARYAAEFSDTFDDAFEDAFVSKFRSGWVVGAGASIKVTPNISIQPEFLHADFGALHAPSNGFTTGAPPVAEPGEVFTHRADLKVNIARVGFHFHF